MPSLGQSEMNGKHLLSLIAGEELIADRFNSILRTTQDWNWIVLSSPGTTEQLVSAEPCRLGPVISLNGAAPGTIAIRDASATGSGATAITFATVDDVARAVGIRLLSGETIQFGTGTGDFLVLFREAEFTL